jgi:transcriptional regulator with XRE-family HTH domain
MTTDAIAGRLGKAIRSRRRQLGLSQEAFATQIAMQTAYFGKVERGEKNISIDTLKRIADGLHVLTSTLLAEAGD